MTKETFKNLLVFLAFEQQGKKFTKHFPEINTHLSVDFSKETLIYPESDGLVIHSADAKNFTRHENFVVFECVHRLFEKGYKPENIELEKGWKVGHGASGGEADIFVTNQEKNPLLLIECKVAGKEFEKAWKKMLEDGGQLISYAQQNSQVDFLCLYASDFDEKTSNLATYQRIVSHKDNEKIIQQVDKKLKSFAEARDVKERFQVWRDTYQLEFTEKGIFEENIQPYQIGKDKYTLEIDTRPIDSTDRKGKYHQFRTILRKHNIARKETAFEVLVNLFLCKIVDEKENKNDLDFYWKGIAYDNYFDFVDRLQKLYKIGMDRFLKEEITYISNDEIDNAFWTVRNKRNATRKTIQDYFRQLKFFTNNAFSFRDVHNEEIFIKNSKILLEIVQMWQNLRLTTDTQNQFLGDMFEFFLDNSIKQSEGQFFTPVPICKFIVASLPLENSVTSKAEPLRAIDYACGAGHFLNEYALQIQPIVEKHKQTDIKQYYENIFGIEKEDRLAKIAKVAAFMYGQDEIVIRDVDALDRHAEIQDESFDVLVANPPFAVEGFLETLPEEQRDTYELLQTVNDLNNKNIQCFFIERAKQLLAPNAIAGIIVPSSVLSNSDSTHIASREILLKYFDIVALVELGSGTFGKTGTNTIVLFIRRKALKPEPAEHYKNRVEDFFEGVAEGDKDTQEYQDLYLIRAYCQQIEVDYEEYKKLLNATLKNFDELNKLFEYEIFKDYKADFERSAEVKNLINSPQFKRKSDEDQKTELNKRLIAYLQRIEKDKLYYYILAHNNAGKVLIVKSPSDTKEQKQFLGYEWSGAKGQEGIKYNGGEIVSEIITPMFDPNNRDNHDKISWYIQQNFIGKELNAPNDYVSYAKLTDLLDFSRKDFNKAITLTPKKDIIIETKWEIKKLSELVEIISGGTPDTNNQNYWNGDIPWLSVADFNNDERFVSKTEKKITELGLQNSSAKYLQPNDIIISARGTVGALAQLAVPMTFNQSCYGLRAKPEKINDGYLYYILKNEVRQFKANASGITFGAITISSFDSVKIPLPPLETQKLIVQECESVDAEVTQAQANIEEAKAEIEKTANDIYDFDKSGYKLVKLGSVCEKPQYGANESAKDGNSETDYRYIRITDINENGELNNDWQTVANVEEKYILKDGDFLFARSGATVGKTFLYKNKYGKALYAGYLIRFRTSPNKLIPDFLKLLTHSEFYKQWVSNTQTGTSQPNINGQMYSDLTIPVPPLPIQEKFVAEITKLEEKIAEARKIIESSAERKQAIMKKYL